MSQWHSFSYWGSLLTDCWILCGIGMLFGLRFTRLFPGLLATGGICLALTISPQIAGAMSQRKLALTDLERSLGDSPARFFAFCGMTLVLLIYGIAHSRRDEPLFEPEDGAGEGELDARLYPLAPTDRARP